MSKEEVEFGEESPEIPSKKIQKELDKNLDANEIN